MVGVVFVLGMAVLSFGVPSHVISGDDIQAGDLEWLVEQEFLLESEKPVELAFTGVFSREEGGSLLTDQYVGLWMQDGGSLVSYWYEIGEICSINRISAGSDFEHAAYRLAHVGDDDWIQIALPIKEDGDGRFVRKLTRMNADAQSDAQRKACETGVPLKPLYPQIVGGEDVSEEHRAWLIEREMLFEGETITYFHSAALETLEEDGTMLTDHVFGTWTRDDGEMQAWWFEFEAICAAFPMDEQPVQDVVWYEVRGEEGESWVQFSLPSQEGADQRFMQRLDEFRGAAGGDLSAPVCERAPNEDSAATGEVGGEP